MMVPERGFRGYGGRLRGLGSILTTGTAAGAESPADVLKAIAPGSQPVTSIEQLAAGRGSFIFLESQNVPLTVGILGFTSGSSKGVMTTIFYTYGPEAGKIAFHNATDLLAPGWRIVDKSRSEAAYRAGAVTAMPSMPAPSMEPLGASMEKALSLVDEAMALMAAKDYETAAPKIASAKEVLSDTGWHLGFMLDTGHVDRQTFGSIKKTIDALAAANSALEKANLNRTDVDAIVAQAKKDMESAFALVAKDTVRQSKAYAVRSENVRNMRLRTKELLALSQPFKGDPKIAPLINVLELDSAILDDAVSKLDVDENAITAALESPSVDGFRGLGQAGRVLSAIGRLFLRMWRRPMTLLEAKAMAQQAGTVLTSGQLVSLAKRGTPTWFRMLAGHGVSSAGWLITSILPMWYFFAPNSPLHKNAAAEAEKRSLAYTIASQRFHELLAQGMATKDALVKMKEYMAEIEKQLEIDPLGVPTDIPGLDPAVAAAKAAVLAKVKQMVDANAAAAVGDKGTSPLVWILGAGAVALVLYLIISGKQEVPVARLTKPAKRR